MITGLIPLPGSAGVSEYFFTKLFYNENNPREGFYFISQVTEGEAVTFRSASYSLTVSALLLWRSITFIFPIVTAGFTTAFYRASPKEEIKNREDLPNRGTFVALQNETYVMRKEEVDALVHTASLSRKAILARMTGRKLTGDKEKKDAPKKRTTKKEDTAPINVKAVDYSEVDIKEEDDSI